MFFNWAKETTTSTGTGNTTVSAISGFPRISSVVGLGVPFYYSYVDDSTGAPIESGIGYMSDANTHVRTKILETMVSGTFDNISPSAVSLAAGTKRLMCTGLAQGIQPAMPYVGNAGGYKYVTNGLLNQPTNNGSTYPLEASGRINVHPFLSLHGGEFDAFAIRVGTAESSKIVRVGLYEVASTGNPGKLIVESASIDIGTTGLKTGTFSAMAIPAGWYFIGLLTTSTTGVLFGTSQASSDVITRPTPFGCDGDFNVGLGGYATGLATTAMPAACPALNLTVNIKVPAVALRAV